MTMITDNGDRKGGYLDILLAAVDFAAPANANHLDSCSTSNGLCGNQMDLHESKAAFDGNERDTSEFSLPFDAWKSSGSNPPAETSRVDTLKHLLQRNQGGKFDVKKASLGVMAEISSGTPKNNQVTKLQLIKNEQVLPHSSSCPQLDNSKSRCSGKLKDGKDDELAKFDVVTSSEDAVDCTLSIQAFGDYVDYSREIDTTPNIPLTAPNRCPSFLVKLYSVLSHQELSHIITWLPHGRSWTLIDPIEFEVSVIPKYFGSGTSIISFTKRVTKLGFRRISFSIDTRPDSKRTCATSYFHDCFLRGKPHLMKRIHAQDKKSCVNSLSKGSKNSTISNEAITEADLAKISMKRPLPMDIMPKNDESATIMRMLDKFISEKGPKNRVPVSIFQIKPGTETDGKKCVQSFTGSRKSAAKRKLEQCEEQMAKRPKVFLSSATIASHSKKACHDGLDERTLKKQNSSGSITLSGGTLFSQHGHVTNENVAYNKNRMTLNMVNSLQLKQQNQATAQLDSNDGANNVPPLASSIPVNVPCSISYGRCFTIPNQKGNNPHAELPGNELLKNLVSQAFVAGIILGSSSMRGNNCYNGYNS